MIITDWFKSHGFNNDGETYCICGDTYAIKDWLKKQGCKFDPVFKWHSPTFLELPDEYTQILVSYKDYMQWDDTSGSMFYYEDSQLRLTKKIREEQGPSEKIFYPEPAGTRIRNITAVFKSVKGFEGIYGFSYVYTFESGDYTFVWITTSEKDFQVGDLVDLSGTIKKFDDFRGVNTTVLTRCIIKIIERPD